jgi:hypothetical protein
MKQVLGLFMVDEFTLKTSLLNPLPNSSQPLSPLCLIFKQLKQVTKYNNNNNNNNNNNKLGSTN